MSPAPSRRSSAVLVGAVIILAIYALAGFSFAPVSFTPRSSLDRVGDSEVLPVPSRTYIWSDCTRLGLRWTYAVAEDSQSPLVDVIMSQVQSLRQEALGKAERPLNITIKLPSKWPSPDIAPTSFGETPAPVPVSASDFKPPLTCATENFTLSSYSPRLPEYKILSRSRIACWHSHLSVIQGASTHERDKAVLILEDDVDMEADIKERLSSIWSLLPSDWDIVFLGHCWSNESHYPPLGYVAEPLHNFDLPSSTSTTLLHPSHGPLCTHAYALSPTGAKRLLLHLMHPPFAYSRAIDHALVWLVRSGRLNSFSVVPSVVVQRKVGKSDVMPMAGKGKGSGWRDRLVHGVPADSDATSS
ncbi:hypothetical protein K438DRAFT_1880077 [Mycena galopus ATCC 62051]|nr:hypothetical protein K438DRAFT_1880077 [Mycena galopus ATCC 62051]